MENLHIRCKSCNREMEGHPTRTIACGCSNMATIRGDKISAVDLSKVVMLNSIQIKERSGVLTTEDLAFQEARRQRKVRRLDFEVR
jgi:hypothetical protein